MPPGHHRQRDGGQPDHDPRSRRRESPVLTRPQPADFNYNQNNIEIISSSYLVIRGLHFKGGNAGVSFIGGHHITFEGNEISETGNNAIRTKSWNTDAFVIRSNHIHHTGFQAPSAGPTEGDGMYIGCHDGSCIASNHLVEGNSIHHTRGTSSGLGAAGGAAGACVAVGGAAAPVFALDVVACPRCGGRRRLVGVYTGGAPLQTLLERLGLEGTPSSAEPSRSPPRASEEPDWPLRRPALGPGVRRRLSLAGLQPPAALGVPPREPGCRRSFASEPGQALLTWAAGGAIVVPRGGPGRGVRWRRRV